ncbi:hypothetical protein DBV08_09045 [Rhodococcus sp. KBW08]|nr:hypothetical protein DBV08_09045 [Rhodococcus sp. KBW08]
MIEHVSRQEFSRTGNSSLRVGPVDDDFAGQKALTARLHLTIELNTDARHYVRTGQLALTIDQVVDAAQVTPDQWYRRAPTCR